MRVISYDWVILQRRIAYHNGYSKTLNDLKWDKGAGSSMRQSYGLGSRKTSYNNRKNERELASAASSSYDIKAVFQRQIDLGISLATEQGGVGEAEELSFHPFRQIAMEELPTGGPGEEVIAKEKKMKNLAEAIKDLESVLAKRSEQVKRYGGELTGHLLLRHKLVHSFFLIQKKCRGGRRALALQVANSYGRGHHTARMIVLWERSWTENRTIPARRTGSNSNRVKSIFEDEDILLTVREYMEKSGDGTVLPSTIQFIIYVNCY